MKSEVDIKKLKLSELNEHRTSLYNRFTNNNIKGAREYELKLLDDSHDIIDQMHYLILNIMLMDHNKTLDKEFKNIDNHLQKVLEGLEGIGKIKRNSLNEIFGGE